MNFSGSNWSFSSSKPIFLSPDAYDLNESKSDISISSAKAEYILFPHAISSTSNKFGWDYLNELNELRKAGLIDLDIADDVALLFTKENINIKLTQYLLNFDHIQVYFLPNIIFTVPIPTQKITNHSQ